MPDRYRQKLSRAAGRRRCRRILPKPRPAFDAVVADRARAAGKFAGEWLDLPHFAVSGRLMAAV
ncbi:hypothetical protein [Desulfobulbus oralis]|uniref:hypothetical protein n=1 Tax=Desulfobulbus oralis TaxID=1986146 RepID=UPI0011B0A2A8|nr:hypothetical protein [Desulfobulbus oralis]